MRFSASVKQASSDSLVNEVFARDCVLATEAVEEANVPAGFVALIGNYRGFTMSNSRGRKARNVGDTVVDLSSLSKIALSDVPNLIERLQELLEEAPSAMSTLDDLAEIAMGRVSKAK